MFGSKQGDTTTSAGPRVRTANGTLSIIGAEVTITGNLDAGGDLHLDGTVEGDLRCGSFILGPSGRVKGNIVADKAQLAGTVEGTVSASELILDATARVSGDMSYATVTIANGARVDGRVAHRDVSNDAAGALKLVASGE
jgi:cytoskeletal protein CcmA (bactofilin family)